MTWQLMPWNSLHLTSTRIESILHIQIRQSCCIRSVERILEPPDSDDLCVDTSKSPKGGRRTWLFFLAFPWSCVYQWHVCSYFSDHFTFLTSEIWPSSSVPALCFVQKNYSFIPWSLSPHRTTSITNDISPVARIIHILLSFSKFSAFPFVHWYPPPPLQLVSQSAKRKAKRHHRECRERIGLFLKSIGHACLFSRGAPK